MITFESKITIKATPETIFSLYADVSNWNKWDPEVKKSSINGTFISGVIGKLKPISGPESKIKIERVNINKSFLVTSNLPLCKMSFDHQLSVFESSVDVIHSVSFTGLLSPLFARLIGSQIKKGLPNSMAGLKRVSEAKS